MWGRGEFRWDNVGCCCIGTSHFEWRRAPDANPAARRYVFLVRGRTFGEASSGAARFDSVGLLVDRTSPM